MTQLLETAKRFTDEIVAPNAAAWAQSRNMQPEALRQAASMGLLGFQAPKEWGGHDFAFHDKLSLLMMMSRHSYDFAFSLTNTAGAASHIAEVLPRPVAERYVPAMLRGERFGGSALSEPGAGSDFAGIKTRAEKTPGGWRLNGEKGWITNAAFGDVFITYAQTDPAQGDFGQGGRRRRLDRRHLDSRLRGDCRGNRLLNAFGFQEHERQHTDIHHNQRDDNPDPVRCRLLLRFVRHVRESRRIPS